MTFLFDLAGGRRLEFRLGEPCPDARGAHWACRVEWSGCETGAVVVRGASSLQSVKLALDFVQQELGAVAQGPVFQNDRPVAL